MNKPNFAQIFKSAQAAVSRHSPEILTGIGIAGMVTATILAVKATPKALELIEEKKKEEDRETLTPVEVVKTTWKCYVPTIVTAASSIGCLLGSTHVSLRRNAALATAYKISETAILEYRDQVVEEIGEKKEQAIRDKVSQKQIDKNPISKNEVYVTSSGESICLDSLSGRYFKSDIERIRKVENLLNKQMIHDICGTAMLNDFYDELDLPRTEVGDVLGWDTEHLIDLDISPGISDEGKPCLVIGHYNAPVYKP